MPACMVAKLSGSYMNEWAGDPPLIPVGLARKIKGRRASIHSWVQGRKTTTPWPTARLLVLLTVKLRAPTGTYLSVMSLVVPLTVLRLPVR